MHLSPGKDWPFDKPRKVAVFTTIEIVSRNKPVLYVSHDADDGAWQFLTGETVTVDNGRTVALSEINNPDPSVAELRDLPLGWCATRKDISSPWKRFEHERRN